MNVRAILEELERLGVGLYIVGDDLEYEGPQEAITPELLERLKANKADLMMFCRKTATVAEEDRNPAEAGCTRNTTDPETRKLSAARWEPKERGGKTLWRQPDSGTGLASIQAHRRSCANCCANRTGPFSSNSTRPTARS